MAEFILTFMVMVAVIAAMAVGVIYGRAPISGSCGGLGNMGVDGACEICGGDTSKCEEQTTQKTSSKKPAFYDAS